MELVGGELDSHSCSPDIILSENTDVELVAEELDGNNPGSIFT